MFRSTVAVILVTALGGCVSSPLHSVDRHAIVDDVTSKAPYIADNCVVAVDGKPVRRARSPTVTVIPMALVEAGEHTLTLNILSKDSLAYSTVTATFEAGKGYRIKSENGELSVVEKIE
ncbi:MAG: hypothetical protein H8E44_18175 [Planctomycetes bacterium]|nr:hypothetical protein [Planctomycetota bacterium]